jgi:hypothetical protein
MATKSNELRERGKTTRFGAPRTPPRRHRLTPAVEQHIRAMVEGSGVNQPSVRVLLNELDAVREERDAMVAELGTIQERMAHIEGLHRWVMKLYPDAAEAAREAGIQVEADRG